MPKYIVEVTTITTGQYIMTARSEGNALNKYEHLNEEGLVAHMHNIDTEIVDINIEPFYEVSNDN